MMTKTLKAKSLIFKGDYKAALYLLKTFKRGFTKEEMRIMQIAYECMAGKSAFYEALGTDVNKTKDDAIRILYSWVSQ